MNISLVSGKITYHDMPWWN